MAREKEIKIILKIPLNDFIKQIENKGFKLLRKQKQRDIYFDTKDWFLYENIAALRIRQVNGKDNSFSFKKVFCLAKKRDYYVEEIEVKFPIKNISATKEIFERLNIPFAKPSLIDGKEISKYLAKYGYFDEQKMAKVRTVYSNEEDEVVIDDVENVGIIVELECRNNEPLHIVKTLLKENEWERSLEGTSYIWLKNVRGLTSHVKNLERFITEPNWNIWENEAKFYSKISK